MFEFVVYEIKKIRNCVDRGDVGLSLTTVGLAAFSNKMGTRIVYTTKYKDICVWAMPPRRKSRE